MNSKQQQRSGDHSTNLQVNVNGLSYSEARTLFLDLFKQNFIRLQQDAARIATARAEEITDKFLEKFAATHGDVIVNPENLDPQENVDLQMALLTVQREYARTGDKELGDLLVDMLVDRSTDYGRSSRRLILRDALDIAPRVTASELALLSIVSWTYNVTVEVAGIAELCEALRRNLLPFSDRPKITDFELWHLVSSGCMVTAGARIDIIDLIKEKYQGLFNYGFRRKDSYMLPAAVDRLIQDGVFVPNSRRPKNIQVNAPTWQQFGRVIERLPELNRERMTELYRQGGMGNREVEQELCGSIPGFEAIINWWRSAGDGILSPIGIALGHANWRQVTGGTDSLESWLSPDRALVD